MASETAPAEIPVRDAATVIVLRRDGDGAPRVLMGQRGAKAAFMPSKFVFPGGAVDPGDRVLARDAVLNPRAARMLAHDAPEGLGPALGLAAVRELWEETGLALAGHAPGGTERTEDLPECWRDFCARFHAPATEALELICRAITPPGRPRRFDARFFLVEADALANEPDAFETIDHELSHLSWLTLAEARGLDLPFITEVVLAELEARLDGEAGGGRPAPFFRHAERRSFFDAIRG